MASEQVGRARRAGAARERVEGVFSVPALRAANGKRVIASLGATALLGGTVAASVAQRAGPTSDFVSTLGVRGRRLAWAFRAGQGLAAAACLRLGGSALAAARQTDGADRRQWSEVVFRREPRGAALAASGCLLAAVAAVPCSAACPIPLVEGTDMASRDWFHVPVAIATFYLLPVAAHGWTRALLAANLAPLIPLLIAAPHGSATAVLQRTMMLLAAAALLTWQSTQGL